MVYGRFHSISILNGIHRPTDNCEGCTAPPCVDFEVPRCSQLLARLICWKYESYPGYLIWASGKEHVMLPLKKSKRISQSSEFSEIPSDFCFHIMKFLAFQTRLVSSWNYRLSVAGIWAVARNIWFFINQPLGKRILRKPLDMCAQNGWLPLKPVVVSIKTYSNGDDLGVVGPPLQKYSPKSINNMEISPNSASFSWSRSGQIQSVAH